MYTQAHAHTENLDFFRVLSQQTPVDIRELTVYFSLSQIKRQGLLALLVSVYYPFQNAIKT